MSDLKRRRRIRYVLHKTWRWCECQRILEYVFHKTCAWVNCEESRHARSPCLLVHSNSVLRGWAGNHFLLLLLHYISIYIYIHTSFPLLIASLINFYLRNVQQRKYKMGLCRFLFFVVVVLLFSSSSSVDACDRCPHHSKAAFFSSASALSCIHYLFLIVLYSSLFCFFFLIHCLALQPELVLMVPWLRLSSPVTSPPPFLLSTKTALAAVLAFRSDATTPLFAAPKEPRWWSPTSTWATRPISSSAAEPSGPWPNRLSGLTQIFSDKASSTLNTTGSSSYKDTSFTSFYLFFCFSNTVKVMGQKKNWKTEFLAFTETRRCWMLELKNQAKNHTTWL